MRFTCVSFRRSATCEPSRNDAVERVGRALRARQSDGNANTRARSARSTFRGPLPASNNSFNCMNTAKGSPFRASTIEAMQIFTSAIRGARVA